MNTIKLSQLLPSIIACLTLCVSSSKAADNLADAQNVGFGTWITESNATATQEVSEPSGLGYKTLWWKFTTTKRCVVIVKTPEIPALGLRHYLTVFRGDEYDSLNIIERSQGWDSGTSISFPAEAGMTFRVCVGNYYSSDSGNVTIAVLQSTWPYATGNVVIPAKPTDQAPPNDRFDSAQVIPSNVTSGTVIGYLGSAQAQPDESLDKTGVPAVWYAWKAPFTGTLKISTPQAPGTLGFRHALSVFTGADSSNLKPIASGRAYYSDNVELSFGVVAGTTYRISFGFFDNSWHFGEDPSFYVLQMQASKLNPDITVRVLNGAGLRDGSSTLSLGKLGIKKTRNKIIVVRNDGKATLTDLRIKKSGKNASDFSIGAFPTATLSPGNETSIVVRFKPKKAGIRTAAIRIFSNDPDENPFDIKLAGMGFKR